MLVQDLRVDELTEDGCLHFLEGDVPAALMIVEHCVKLEPGHAKAWELSETDPPLRASLDNALQACCRAKACDRGTARLYLNKSRVHLNQPLLNPSSQDPTRMLDLMPGTALYVSILAGCVDRTAAFNQAAALRHWGTRRRGAGTTRPTQSRIRARVMLEPADSTAPAHSEPVPSEAARRAVYEFRMDTTEELHGRVLILTATLFASVTMGMEPIQVYTP